MSVFSNLFHKKNNPESPAFRREMAQRIAQYPIKYVTERKDDVDEVIGKHGSLSVRDGIFLVYASNEILFRCPVDELSMSELLSKDGVILSGKDMEHGGAERKIIAYYVYYLK